jgi:hypothetical protein
MGVALDRLKSVGIDYVKYIAIEMAGFSLAIPKVDQFVVY